MNEDMNWRKTVNERGQVVIVNPHGVELEIEAALGMMDDNLREELHMLLSPCSEALFYAAYAAAHRNLFGEEWELAKQGPVW